MWLWAFSLNLNIEPLLGPSNFYYSNSFLLEILVSILFPQTLTDILIHLFCQEVQNMDSMHTGQTPKPHSLCWNIMEWNLLCIWWAQIPKGCGCGLSCETCLSQAPGSFTHTLPCSGLLLCFSSPPLLPSLFAKLRQFFICFLKRTYKTTRKPIISFSVYKDQVLKFKTLDKISPLWVVANNQREWRTKP